jgi:hypothetical protein
VAQGHLKDAVKNREMICMLLASGEQNNYKISNQTHTTGKMTKERWERSTEDNVP